MVGTLLAGRHARADGLPKLRLPARLVLRQVKMQNSDLAGALQILRQEAEKQSGGTVKVSFAPELPKDFKPLYELTLDLHAIPFPDALRCIGELAGVDFFVRGEVIVVRAKQTATVAQPAPPAPAGTVASLPVRMPTSALAKPPERVGVGDGVRRAMDGSVQLEQSGRVTHRALDGWSTDTKPGHVFDANCVRVAQCPNGCGCSMCTCRKTPVQ